ncbi:hypothetical protein RRG08_046170 [Elysia crispata]|uniref:Uncharacterized protein n=1 Tax=Elysia crispata TaxID=231223 RepID=A0AAE0XNH4_9GAST|nr:hypothetical protein RRG08_046170 [Elysia crispata]
MAVSVLETVDGKPLWVAAVACGQIANLRVHPSFRKASLSCAHPRVSDSSDANATYGRRGVLANYDGFLELYKYLIASYGSTKASRAMVPSGLHHSHTYTLTHSPEREVSKGWISLSVYHSRYEIDPVPFHALAKLY